MRKLWATARQTFIEAVRNRLTAVMVAVLIGLILLLQFVARAGGATLKEQVQTYLAYSIALCTALLSVMTVLLGCRMLCGEVENRSVFLPLTKPVPRWVHIVGRWLGLALLQAILVAAVAASIYGIAQNMRRSESDPQMRAQADEEVFVARAVHAPRDFREMPGFQGQVDERLRALEAEGRLDEAVKSMGSPEAVRMAVEQDLMTEFLTAPPLGLLGWEFRGLKVPADGEDVQLRFTYKSLPSRTPPQQILNCAWQFESSDRRMVRIFPRNDAVRMKVDIMVPADVIGPDGVVRAIFINRDPYDINRTFETSVTIMSEDISLSYPVSGFAANFVRGMLMVWFVQAFLAAVAMLAGSFLSFPVACLVSFFTLLVGLAASFILESATLPYDYNIWETVGHYAVRGLFFVVPEFSQASPTGRLIDGEIIRWSAVLTVAVRFLLVQTGLCLLAAGFIYSRRELARVIA